MRIAAPLVLLLGALTAQASPSPSAEPNVKPIDFSKWDFRKLEQNLKKNPYRFFGGATCNGINGCQSPKLSRQGVSIAGPHRRAIGNALLEELYLRDADADAYADAESDASEIDFTNTLSSRGWAQFIKSKPISRTTYFESEPMMPKKKANLPRADLDMAALLNRRAFEDALLEELYSRDADADADPITDAGAESEASDIDFAAPLSSRQTITFFENKPMMPYMKHKPNLSPQGDANKARQRRRAVVDALMEGGLELRDTEADVEADAEADGIDADLAPLSARAAKDPAKPASVDWSKIKFKPYVQHAVGWTPEKTTKLKTMVG